MEEAKSEPGEQRAAKIYSRCNAELRMKKRIGGFRCVGVYASRQLV